MPKALQLLNFTCEKTGQLTIDEDIAPGWRFARTEWRFGKSAILERHGQSCRIRMSVYDGSYDFNPANRLSDSIVTETAYPGDSDPPQFDAYSSQNHIPEMSIEGTRCHLALELFDADGNFNQALPWKTRDDKPTLTLWLDLWARPIQFAKPPTYEEVVATYPKKSESQPSPGAVTLSDEDMKELGIELEDADAANTRIESTARIRLRRMRFELALTVYPPPPMPRPQYNAWWERTFPGLHIVSGGRPESNRRKF